MTASFWLPENASRQVVTAEEPDGLASSETETAKSETPFTDHGSGGPKVPATTVAVDDVGPELEKTVNASEPENDRQVTQATGSNRLSTTVGSDAVDGSQRRTVDAGPSREPSDPAAALAALVSKNPSTSPSSPASETVAVAQPDTVAVPATAETSRTTPASVPAPISPSIDDTVRQANAPANSEEVAPVRTTDRADLPPRIRQALLRASADAGGPGPETGRRLYRVQLAAVDDEAAARIFWREINARLPGVFTDVEPIFDRRVVDERLYLRVWVGAFDDRSDALGYCSWLKNQGQDCFVTRVDNL